MPCSCSFPKKNVLATLILSTSVETICGTLLLGRASTGGRSLVDAGRDNESVGGGSPVNDALWTGSGKQGEKEEVEGKALRVDDSTSQDELWIPLTKTEKRRLWLRRRRAGEFFFRSEFKGLVHAVRIARYPNKKAAFGVAYCGHPDKLTLEMATKPSLSHFTFCIMTWSWGSSVVGSCWWDGASKY